MSCKSCDKKRNSYGYPMPKAETKMPKWGIALIVLALLSLVFVVIARAEEVNLNIIAKIESSNNPLAYNRHSGARGLYQITAVCLEEYNQHHTSKIASNALFSPVVARLVAKWYLSIRIPQMLKYYGIKDTIETRLACYNAGIGKVVKGIMPEETKNYIAKYMRLANANH